MDQQNVVVSRRTPETEKQAAERRGIVRDKDGKIVWTLEQRKERIARLKEKRADMEQRIKNIDAQVAADEEIVNAAEAAQ